jgi:heme exporter protein C
VVEGALGRITARRGERALAWVAVISLLVSGVLSLAVAPPDAEQGQVQRLMYVHVPAAWLAYLAFLVVFVGSVAYLKTGRLRWDRLAGASAEVGVLFTALAIGLGMLWGKPVWGTWWTWDPRLTTTALLLMIYVGYLAVRRLPEGAGKRARWAAVVGIVGFADVPVVHLSVTWWRSLHQDPTVLRLEGPTLAPMMLGTLLVAVAAFTLSYLYLMVLRLRVGRLEDRAVAEVLSPRVEARPEDLLAEQDGPAPGPSPEVSARG